MCEKTACTVWEGGSGNGTETARSSAGSGPVDEKRHLYGLDGAQPVASGTAPAPYFTVRHEPGYRALREKARNQRVRYAARRRSAGINRQKEGHESALRRRTRPLKSRIDKMLSSGDPEVFEQTLHVETKLLVVSVDGGQMFGWTARSR